MNDMTALLPYVKLKFNIEHPSVEESYSFGYECAKASLGEEENPFALGTSEYEQWGDGWWAGFYDEEPLFEVAETKDNTVTQISDSANDISYKDGIGKWVRTALEITGVIAVSAVVGYQVLEMVA